MSMYPTQGTYEIQKDDSTYYEEDENEGLDIVDENGYEITV